MVEKARPTIIAGNWKMYKTIEETRTFIHDLIPLVIESQNFIYLAVPFTSIFSAVSEAHGSKITIGAQNMHDANEGAYTGEISAIMLNDAGAKFVILGHSERRHIFGEDNSFINRKVKQAFREGLQPILCIGETEEERNKGNAEKVLEEQLVHCMEGLVESEIERLVLAYEPVWAIGTGKTAFPEQAQQMHLFCRKLLAKNWGAQFANRVPILYGGSVKPANIRALLEQSDIDGVLVGGASLEVETFAQLVNYQTIMCK